MAILDALHALPTRLGDVVTFRAPGTSGTFTSGTLNALPTDSGRLTVRLVDPGTGELGATVLSDLAPTGQFLGENFWDVSILSGTYLPRTYYRAEVSYSGTGPVLEPDYHLESVDDGGPIVSGTHQGKHAYLIHVTDQAAHLELLRRAAGLAGANNRHVQHNYVRGTLVDYRVRLYRDAQALANADAGVADDFFAEYGVDLTYDDNLNRTRLTSTRQS